MVSNSPRLFLTFEMLEHRLHYVAGQLDLVSAFSCFWEGPERGFVGRLSDCRPMPRPPADRSPENRLNVVETLVLYPVGRNNNNDNRRIAGNIIVFEGFVALDRSLAP